MVRNLVDQDLKGRLSKEEFVVGMWLVDQSLSGRKLPSTKVPPEVWRSVGRLAVFLRTHRRRGPAASSQG
jgi:hypothetical protein